MDNQKLQKLAVVWFALWFGVIVPGHKRGLVLLPGGKPQVTVKQSEEAQPCPLAKIMGRSSSCCCPPSDSSDAPQPGAPVTHCAICYLTGVLDVPPAPDFAPKPLELVQVLAWPQSDVVEATESVRTYLGRAPPLG